VCLCELQDTYTGVTVLNPRWVYGGLSLARSQTALQLLSYSTHPQRDRGTKYEEQE